jgi:hypothetical protein
MHLMNSLSLLANLPNPKTVDSPQKIFFQKYKN